MTGPLERLADPTVSRHRSVLPNGLRVVCETGGSSPVVALQLWFATNGRVPRALGHLLEHLLMESADHLHAEGLMRRVERLGGEINAWTTADSIAFLLVVPVEHLDEGLQILANVGFRPRFERERIEHERQVLERERQGGPRRGALMQAIDAVMSRTAREVVPEPDGAGFDEIVACHRDSFGTGSAVLAVAGDVPAERVVELAGRHFGDLAGRAGNAPLPATPFEPIVVLEGRAPRCGLSIAYSSADTRPEVEAALTALSLISVDRQDRSGLRDALACEELAFDFRPALHAAGAPFVLSWYWLAPPEHAVEIVRSATAAIDRLRRWQVPQRSLDDARWAFALETADENDAPQSRARRLAFFELWKGGIESLAPLARAFAALGPRSLREAASELLAPDRRLVLAVAPQPHAATLERELRAATSAPKPRTTGRAQPRTGPAVRTLGAGTPLVVDRDGGGDLATVLATFRGAGAIGEPRNARASAVALARALRVAAPAAPHGRWDVEAGADAIRVRFSCVGDLLADWLEWLEQTLAAPTLEECAHGLSLAAATAESAAADPEAVVLDLVAAGHFAGHPYGEPSAGSAASLARLKPEQVARYAARALTVDRLGFAAAGCDDDTALGDALERVLARTGLPATGPAPAAREVGAASGPAVWSADLEGPELTAAVSWRGVAPGDPGRPALAILDCALTWYGGRIFRALREERPLLYSLQTSERWLRGAGTYGMLLSCDPAEAAEALAEIGRIVGDVRRRGLDGDEIDRCRSACAGDEQMARQGTEARAIALCDEVELALAPGTIRALRDRFAAVKSAEVRRVAETVLDPRRLALAIAGADARRLALPIAAALLGEAARPRFRHRAAAGLQ